MERNESSLLKITDADLEPFREEVTGYLKTVQWMPDRSKSRSTDIDLSFLTQAAKGLGVQEEDQLSILKNAIRISNDRIILSNVSNQVLNAVRRGYCIGRYLADLYATSSGLELLQQKNQDGSLHQSELPEFHDKSQTQSAILLFAASSYIVHRVGNIFPDEQSSIQIDFNGIPEIVLNRPSRTIQSSLYYYAAYLERTGIVTSDFHLLKMTSLYFDRCVQEVQMRKEALKYSGPFTANQYKLEKEEFTIQGFESTQSVSVKGMAFNPTRMEDIVANKQAKHLFSRYVDRLLCYDFDARKNPMNELGGLPSITLADGKPGTGKSMLIAATATLLHEKCEQLGYPFLFWPLPENIVSTFQGGTAERAMEWFKPMQDPGKIVFAPIDDAENNLEERTRQGVSAGVREFIGVFLRNTEGAYAVNLGNRMISLFTNIPDQIDKAVLSRIQMRASMEGASSEADFMDQDFLWWRKYNELDSRFIDAAKPNGFEFMDAQKLPSTLSDLVDAEYRFTQTDVKTIFEQVDKHHDRTSHDFFGAFYHEIQQKYPFFSSRDLRNIQKAVDARIIDFDLPSIWWEKPEDFFLKDYASKLAMLKELMKSNMKGVTFTQVRLYEALNYIENAVRINQTGVQREIKEAAKRLYIQDEAMKKMRSGDVHE
ncbi:MAG: AAA family ATPase [Flavobacteriales bacterium]|nr:AAA family ATPase [Flavobacteriales bacterium]